MGILIRGLLINTLTKKTSIHIDIIHKFNFIYGFLFVNLSLSHIRKKYGSSLFSKECKKICIASLLIQYIFTRCPRV